MNKARLEAFSDGVFAIIITIMVLEIKVPHGSDWLSLRPMAPVFISYLVSFLYVGIYWGNHHHLLHAAKKVSSGMMWANLHLLFWLSLIPFVTGWAGENHFAPNTMILYAAILFLSGIAFTFLQIAIQNSNPANPQLQEAFAKVKTKGIISLFGYVAAGAVAHYNPAISGVILLAVGSMWLIPDRHLEKAIRE
ncbi:MAG TPA: TMEM175 family protein [Puia sp.]|nr:TMEM175 family protein [Puia sp.]